MSDLFDFGRAASSGSPDVSHGLGGVMKKNQYVLQLLGFPGHADTLKCLIMAVEMGMETDTAVLDILAGQDECSDYLEISPFGMVPALKEADYYVSGGSGIMSYIEARGLGLRRALGVHGESAVHVLEDALNRCRRWGVGLILRIPLIVELRWGGSEGRTAWIAAPETAVGPLACTSRLGA